MVLKKFSNVFICRLVPPINIKKISSVIVRFFSPNINNWCDTLRICDFRTFNLFLFLLYFACWFETEQFHASTETVQEMNTIVCRRILISQMFVFFPRIRITLWNCSLMPFLWRTIGLFGFFFSKTFVLDIIRLSSYGSLSHQNFFWQFFFQKFFSKHKPK